MSLVVRYTTAMTEETLPGGDTDGAIIWPSRPEVHDRAA
jgi:hypothetical protein